MPQGSRVQLEPPDYYFVPTADTAIIPSVHNHKIYERRDKTILSVI